METLGTEFEVCGGIGSGPDLGTGLAQKVQTSTKRGVLFSTNLLLIVSDPEFLRKALGTKRPGAMCGG